jgi:NhaA family Na+:H+ antiporter
MPPKKRRGYKKGSPNRILRTIRPFREFMQMEESGGIVLFLCIIIALIWANSPIASTYFDFWGTKITLTMGDFVLSKPLLIWINELLMTPFFFLIGLEIKREILIGELCTPKDALLPFLTAFGGMVVPAVIYTLFNPFGTPGSVGWAIPIATDIAFTLGILSIFGKQVPSSLRVFLVTLAIVDDIGSVLVIAIFYTEEIYWLYLVLSAVVFLILCVINKLGIRKQAIYILLGIFLWLFLLESGVHATLAGILLAITIPATTKIDFEEFKQTSNQLLMRLEEAADGAPESCDLEVFLNTSHTLENACQDAEAPIQRWEHVLTPWVAFLVVPVFTLTNGGVMLLTSIAQVGTSSISFGIIMGLVIGKPLGVITSVFLTTKLGLSKIPEELNWSHFAGVAFLAGIGFTMSIFVASLSFSDDAILSLAKASILIASMISGIIGAVIIGWTVRMKKRALKPHIPQLDKF